MQYRVIVSFFAGLFVSFVCLFPAFGANVATDAKADLVIQDMANAFKRNDKKRLTALLPQAKGHPLEAFDRSIDVHISRIRAVIEDDPKAPRRVLTVRGAGYVFARKQDTEGWS